MPIWKGASQGAELITTTMVSDILEELKRREPIFHRPEFGTRRADFENMMDVAFSEVGASGRRYSREYVLDELEKRFANQGEDAWQTRDLHCL